MNSIVWLVALMAIMYFMMIRPQQKQKKQRQELLDSLKIGHEVVTIGGIHGEITALSDEEVVLEVAQGVKITMQRTSIAFIKAKEVEEETEAEIQETVEE
ncbi:MAG: preprotein translocase subunit YajC [Clostridia bacterium]|jgi:preprotein translocase subunit YajC|nr:preprotein translocase subunit YajC [Clostridia bacterium]